MAIFRKIQTTFWSDPFVLDLETDKKLFYLYLLTNEKTKQCGIYEISKKQISFDLGYSIDTVSILLKYFSDRDKISYSETTNEIAIKNWIKFNYSSSPKVVKCIDKELKNVKNAKLIQYIYSINTASQEEQEEEQEEEQYLYTPKIFLSDWAKCRMSYLKKPTEIKNLNINESTNFKKLISLDYKQEDFKEAMRGLFKQKNITYGAMLLRPEHLLKNFEKYYTAQLSQDYELYGKEDIKKQKNLGV